MLNELMDLARTLPIELPPPLHRLTVLNRSFTVTVDLNANSTIVRVGAIGQEGLAGRLKYFKGEAGVSFPAFNVPPLYRLQPGAGKDAGRRDESSLRALCAESTSGWSAKVLVQLGKCLQVLSRQLAHEIEGIPSEYSALPELCRRAERLDVTSLHDQLADQLVSATSRSPEMKREWVRCLFRQKFQIVLETADWNEYPANHCRAWEWIQHRLLESRQEIAGEQVEDAFGSHGGDILDPMPVVRVIPIQDVKLRAMSDESPCQKRYGRAGSASFRVVQKSRDSAEGVLRWLAAPERKGKTWRDVAELCGYEKGVLFAHPSVAANGDTDYVGLFSPNDLTDPEGVLFEAAAERVISALQGIVVEHPDAQLSVFVLAKPDGFRTKVLFNAAYDARRIIDAAREWREGGWNVPRIVLPVADPHRHPLVPFPTEVPACVNMDWLCEGTRCAPTSGLRIGDGIVLLVETGTRAKQIAEQALRLVVSNATPLLLALGHTDHRNDDVKKPKTFEWTKKTKRYEKHAKLLPSVLGLLLAKLGYMKGEYMHTAPFLVGRMMALADLLHKEYCKIVRAPKEGGGQQDSEKGLPRQLIGNATMAVAMDSPTAGLARLAERIVLYQGWANTATGKDVEPARETLRQYGKVADELGELALPAQCADADKAQMLLGYLACI